MTSDRVLAYRNWKKTVEKLKKGSDNKMMIAYAEYVLQDILNKMTVEEWLQI